MKRDTLPKKFFVFQHSLGGKIVLDHAYDSYDEAKLAVCILDSLNDYPTQIWYTIEEQYVILNADQKSQLLTV